jgi:hypothetical protein
MATLVSVFCTLSIPESGLLVKHWIDRGYSSECWTTLSIRAVSPCPGPAEATAMQFAQCCKHGLSVLLLPSPSRTTHPGLNHIPGSALHCPTADGIACLSELIISHPLTIVLEVPRGLSHLVWILRMIQVQCLQLSNYRLYLTLPQLVFSSFYPSGCLRVTLPMDRLGYCPQAPFGVSPVNDLLGLRKVGSRNPLDPRCTVIDRTLLAGRNPASAPPHIGSPRTYPHPIPLHSSYDHSGVPHLLACACPPAERADASRPLVLAPQPARKLPA